MNITEKENTLFAKWEKLRPGFVKDGIVDENCYIKSNPKLLFVLKEVNDINGGGWDLRKFLRIGGRPQTWDNIVRWVHGIRNLDKEINWTSIEVIGSELRKEILTTVCVMNLKKSAGSCTTVNDELTEIAKKDKEYIVEQFCFYDPEIIIGCGSLPSELFKELMGFKTNWKMTKRGIRFMEFMNSKYLISYSHPEARVQDCLLYYGLIDAIKEIGVIHNAIVNPLSGEQKQ